MPRGSEHKERLLKVLGVLERETDAEHRLSMTQLLNRLGLDPTSHNDRRNVRGDLVALDRAGYPIATERHAKTEYFLARRRFIAKELKVLVDLVEGARTIPEEMSEGMVQSILLLGSEFEAEEVRTRIRAGNRVKLFNDELLDSIWALRQAINRRRKVRFRYFHYGFDFEPVYHEKEGIESIVETPLLLTHVDGAHYVIALTSEGMEKTRRVDRMTDVEVLDEKAPWRKEYQSFDIDERALFGMFRGEENYVTLEVDERGMNALIDRFGRRMEIANVREVEEGGETKRYADITVKVVESTQFEGWLKGLEELVHRKG